VYGLTLWKRTFYSGSFESIPLSMFRHEQVHKEQFSREPYCFIFKYLLYSLKYGYKNNPYEIEARAAEDME